MDEMAMEPQAEKEVVVSEHKADVDEVILEWYVQELVVNGWRVVSRTPTTANVVRARRWNWVGLLAATVILALSLVFSSIWVGICGFLVMIVVVVDYIRQRPAQNTITTAQAREAARLLEGEAVGRAEQV